MSLRWLLLLAILLGTGCGGNSLPTAADPARARDSLTTVLDAWQGGANSDSLQSRTPAIHVNDPAWSSGKKLVKYEIKSEEAAGQSWRCEVELTVKNGDGAETKQHALYCIDTDPALVIVREP